MDLNELKNIQDPAKRRIYFAAMLSAECVRRGGQRVVVVGGNALEAYTSGGYTTGDTDIVSDKDVTEDVLSGWGFRKSGRMWYSNELDIYIDWRGGTVVGEMEPERVDLDNGLTAFIIAVEDLALDRLRSAAFWDDKDGLMWARTLFRFKTEVGEKVDTAYIIRKAEAEGFVALAERALKEAGIE